MLLNNIAFGKIAQHVLNFILLQIQRYSLDETALILSLITFQLLECPIKGVEYDFGLSGHLWVF